MRVYKYKNQHLGEYHTFKVDNIFQAIYASKNPKKMIDLQIESLYEDAAAVTAIEKYKTKFHSHEMEHALRSLGVAILTDKDTKETIDFGKRYIRFNNKCDCWTPVIFNMKGGNTSSIAIGKTIASRTKPLSKNTNLAQQPTKPFAQVPKAAIGQTLSLQTTPPFKAQRHTLTSRNKLPNAPKTVAPTFLGESTVPLPLPRKQRPLPAMGTFERKCQRVMSRVLRVSKALGFDIRSLNDFYEQMTLPDFNKIKLANPSVTEGLVIRNLRQRALQLYDTLEITNSPDFLERQLPCEELVNKLTQLRELTNSSVKGGTRGRSRRVIDQEEYADQYEGEYADQYEGEYADQYPEEYADQYEGEHVDQYEGEHVDQYHEGEQNGSLWRALFSGSNMREEDDDTMSQDSDYEIDRYEDMPEQSLSELTHPEGSREVLIRYDEYGNEIGRSILEMRMETYSQGSRNSSTFAVFAKWLWAWKLCLIVAMLSATVSFHIAGKLSTKYAIMYGSTNMNSIFDNVSTDSSGAMLTPYEATSAITDGFKKDVRLTDGMLLQFEPFAKSPHEYKNVWHDYKEYSKQVAAPPVCTIQKNAKVFKDVSHMALANEFGLINDYIEYMHTCITARVSQNSPLKLVQERFKKQYATMFLDGTRKPTVANIVKENVFQYVVEEFAELVKSDPIKFNTDMDRLLEVKDIDEEVRGRMNRFRARVEQVRANYKEGSVSTTSAKCKPGKTQDAEVAVKTRLHAYTWQLMTDIFNSFHDIGKEQLITHNQYIPVIKRLLDLKMDLREITKLDPSDEASASKKLREILEEMTKLPQIEPFTTLMVIFESSVPSLLPKADQSELYESDFSDLIVPDVSTIRRVVNNAVSIIQGRNEHMRKTVEDYVKAYENAEYLESTFSIFGGVRGFGEMAINQLSPIVETKAAQVAFKIGSQQLSVSLGDMKTVAFELQTNIMNTLQQVQFRETDQMHLNMLAPVVGSSFAMKSLTTFMQSSVGATTLSIIRNLENADPAFRSLTQGMASAWNIGSSILDTMSRDTRFANVRLFHAAIKYNYERAGIANIRNIDQKDGFYALQKSWQVFDAMRKKGSMDLESGFYEVIRVVGVRAFTEWTESYRQQTMFEMEMLSNMLMNTLLTVGKSPAAAFGDSEAAQLRMYDLNSIVMDGEPVFDMEKTSVDKLAIALLKRMMYMVMAESFRK